MPFPAAEDIISREEIFALIAERAATPEAFTSGRVQLSANKLDLPKLICLDTKDWIALARAHNGKAPDSVEVLAFLRAASAAGEVAFPLTTTNISEVMSIGDAERRQRLASFMVELSGNRSLIDRDTIRETELYNAVATQFARRPPRPLRSHLMRWGVGSAMRVAGVSAVGLAADVNAFLNDILNHPRISERALGRLSSAECTKEGRAKDALWCTAAEQMRADTSALSLADRLSHEARFAVSYGATSLTLQKVAVLLGIEWLELEGWLQSHDNAAKLMLHVPSFDIEFRLRRSRDANPQHRLKKNDLKDLLFLSATMPYANAVLADKDWVGPASAIAAQYDVKVARNTTELMSALKAG